MFYVISFHRIVEISGPPVEIFGGLCVEIFGVQLTGLWKFRGKVRVTVGPGGRTMWKFRGGEEIVVNFGGKIALKREHFRMWKF